MKGQLISAKTGKTIGDPPSPPTPEEIKEAERVAAERNRLSAYRAKADPLFFKWQAGEATEQEWLDARNAVRERYPYPE